MSAIALDFYEPDGTTLLGTLDDADLLDLELRPALMELGAIKFSISRHDASAALLTKRNLIKVRVPSVDADPIALFVLKDDSAVLVSKDEEGGEHLEITGPGGLHMLSYARLDEVFYAPGQPRRGNQVIPGEWAWHDVAYGSILARLFEEGVYSPGSPLGALTADFTRDLDSAGNAWYVIAEDFSVPTGSDVLTVANRLCEAGDLFMILGPDLVLHCYQSLSDFARDLTGDFAADTVRIDSDFGNLLTELNRKSHIDRITHLITRDLDKVFRTFVTPDAFDQAVYGFQDIDWTNDPDQVEKTANETLRTSNQYQEEFRVELTPGFAPADGRYMPGPDGTNGHFWLGDSITLNTGNADDHDLNEADVLVTAIVIALDEAADDSTDDKAARSLRIVPEVTYGLPPPAFSRDGITRPPSRLAVPTVTGTPTLSDGDYDSNTASAGITPPAGANAILIHTITATGTPTTTLSYDGVAMTLLKTVIHNVIIPGRSDFVKSQWWVATNVTPGVMQTILFGGGEYYGHVFLHNYVDSADGGSALGNSSTASGTFTGSGGVPVFGLAAFKIGGTGGADPVADAPAVTEWSINVGTGLGQMYFGIFQGDTTPSIPLSGATPWILNLLWVNGALTEGSGTPAEVGTSPDVAHADHNHITENLLTDETDTGLVLVPDGSGGVEWGTGGVTDHGALSGLADDDHPQYLTDADFAAKLASELFTRYEPHVSYDGTVVLDGSGDPVMVEVNN